MRSNEEETEIIEAYENGEMKLSIPTKKVLAEIKTAADNTLNKENPEATDK